MACIDKDGNITRSAELMLLAAIEPNDVDTIIKECGLAPFRVRSGLRELEKAVSDSVGSFSSGFACLVPASLTHDGSARIIFNLDAP
ncbi:MAG: hypothetical protein MUD09_00630, partial [Desulfobacterales bacterium]|nr:hypothetical protein [Desulfobacterales bacterium]